MCILGIFPKDKFLEVELLWQWKSINSQNHEDTQMANKHMKAYATLFTIRKFQIKMWYHYTFIRMANVYNTDNTKCWRECGETGTLTYCWWECKMVQWLWKAFLQFLRKLSVDWPYNLAIALLGICSNNWKTVHTKNLYMNVYISFKTESNEDVHW